MQWARVPKYRNRICYYKNIRFHSVKERNRYIELLLLEKAKKIWDLKLQPRFHLIVGETKICDYVGDFQYTTKGADGDACIVEDVKGYRTPAYKLKAKLFMALYWPGFTLVEV